MNTNFQEITKLHSLLAAKSFEDILLELNLLLNDNRWVAINKTQDIFYKSKSTRTLSNVDSDLVSDTSLEIPAVDYTSDRHCKIISEFISHHKVINQVIVIVIILMNSRIMEDILPNLEITRLELADKIVKFYEDTESRISAEFEKFYEAHPFAKELVDDRARYLAKGDHSNIVNLYKNSDLSPSSSEIAKFQKSLTNLRLVVGDIMSPSQKTLLSYFGMADSTYRGQIQKAKDALIEKFNI